MSMSAGSVADFTGVLVQRHSLPGNSYTQLVFKTAEGVKLSLSRNFKLVHSLAIGQTYRIKGQQRTVGDKTFVHEPVAVQVSANTNWFQAHSKLVIVTAISVVFLGGASIVYAVSQSGESQKFTAASQPAGSSDSSASAVLGASPEQPADEAAATPPPVVPAPAPARPKAAPKAVAPAPLPTSAPVIADSAPEIQAGTSNGTTGAGDASGTEKGELETISNDQPSGTSNTPGDNLTPGVNDNPEGSQDEIDG